MKTEIRRFVAVVSTLGLLASCAQTGALEVQNDNTNRAAQDAGTFADHDSIAKRYENTARALLVKVEEQKKLLQHYEDKSYLYGRQGQDFQSHTVALLRKYEQATKKSTSQAASHHKMALEAVKRNYAAPAEKPRQLSNRAP